MAMSFSFDLPALITHFLASWCVIFHHVFIVFSCKFNSTLDFLHSSSWILRNTPALFLIGVRNWFCTLITGEDPMLSDQQQYRYMTVDDMKSMGDDSMRVNVTDDERDNRHSGGKSLDSFENAN